MRQNELAQLALQLRFITLALLFILNNGETCHLLPSKILLLPAKFFVRFPRGKDSLYMKACKKGDHDRNHAKIIVRADAGRREADCDSTELRRGRRSSHRHSFN